MQVVVAFVDGVEFDFEFIEFDEFDCALVVDDFGVDCEWRSLSACFARMTRDPDIMHEAAEQPRAERATAHAALALDLALATHGAAVHPELAQQPRAAA